VLALSAGLESAESQGSALVVTSTEPPAGWFVTPLGKDSVVFVVNAEFPLQELATEEIVDIFIGRTDNWQSLGGPDLAIQAIVPLQGAESRSYLQQTLLGDRRFTSSALLGPVPEAVLSLVQEDLGAIGFLPLSAVSGDVGLLSIDGLDPMEAANYPFMFEVLATAPNEPGGIVRDWLAWLQASD
jgi:phosphate transport system substrate-binding protein